MTTTKKINQVLFSIFLFILSICLTLCSVISIKDIAYAEDMASPQQITVTNGDFNSSSTTALQSTPSGWTKSGSSTGKNGVINVSENSFSSRASSYALSSTENPGKPYTIQDIELDNHIMMINAKSKATTSESNHLGYVSSTIALKAYSYYKISVWTLTQENAVASIYVSGLGDDVENASFERYSTNVWTEYRFYIATGIDSKNATIELWLGSKTKDSLNAVFFDHITVNQISNNFFYDEAEKYLNSEYDSNRDNLLKRINIIDLREPSLNLITNPNFETGNFDGWKVVNYLPKGADAKIVSIQNRASMESLGLEYLGSSYSAKNNYALTLYSTGKDLVNVGYESTSFNVLPYETYKITVWAKVSSSFSGKAHLTLKEGNAVSNFYGEDYNDFYTPVEKTVEISSNTKNNLTNDYTPYYFYVKGHNLFETNFTLQLWLGNGENGATGCVVFDDISFEKISWEQYNSADTTNATKVELSTVTGSPSVANGTFNNADSLEKDFVYPVTPSDWTRETEDNTKSVYGIINTYSPYYEANKSNYGNAVNPQNPTNSALSVDKDVNNVLMLYNKNDTYQSVTSNALTTTKDSYQRVSFDYKTVQQEASRNLLNVYILDNDNNVLFADENLFSSDWTTYTLLIKSNTYASSLKLKLSLGNAQNLVRGYLYVDNVKFETDSSMTDELYKDYVNAHKTLDFSITNFNFISNEQKHGMYTPFRYEQALEVGENIDETNPVAYGGIINGKDNIYGIENSKNNDNALKYMPAFITNSTSRYTLTSKESLTLEADKYYKISVDAYTRFSGNTEQSDKKDDEKLKYGAIFSLKGIDKQFDAIISNDTWTTYTIYAQVSNQTSVNLRFGIFNESPEIQGQAFFDNFKLETIEKNEYDQGISKVETDKTILSITNSDTKTDDEDNSPNDNNNNTDNSMIWYLIPSAILFVALVIALCGYFMKKVTIKKWERKKMAEYDRNTTLHRDVIRHEAEKIRDSKVKELEAQIADVQAEIERIEQVHKDNLKQNRKTSDKGITRAEERDFKAYAQRHTKLENQVEMLKAKIDSLNMPEYLLSIQRNLMLEKVRKEREEKERQNKLKKEQKRAEKNNKK